MAKVQKYSDDLLLTAVIKYADIYHGKIEASKLAAWAKVNIAGLEDVRDYMFLRPQTIKDVRGNKKEVQRPCTIKINEINNARSVSAGITENVLLKSSDIDLFFSLPRPTQRKLIIDTRAQVDAILTRNAYLEKEYKSVMAENTSLKSNQEKFEAKLDSILKDFKTLQKRVQSWMKHTDEAMRKSTLEKIGIKDGSFDLDKNLEDLSIGIDEAFDIDKTIRNGKTNESSSLASDIIEGIDFK